MSKCFPPTRLALWHPLLIAMLLALPLTVLSFSLPVPMRAHASLTYCSEYPSNYTLTSYNTAVSGTHDSAPPADWGVKTGSFSWGNGSVESCNNNGQGIASGDEITGVFSYGSLITTFD